jgi:hypothetical protein
MKLHIQGSEKRPELSALLTVLALLAAATFAKLGGATQIFHLAHSHPIGFP